MSDVTLDERLLDRFLARDRVALARAISLVENERPGFEAFLHAIHPRIGTAHRLGITGPPGAGKSTITAKLTSALRSAGETVGIVAVDPTSAFTGGALLGDRIRMNDLATDSGVFIRSMAARGALGGLAMSTKEIADLLDAFGFDRVITETVGVGQSELDIADVAETTVVILVPEAGDSIQTLKAGVLEIADVFVVNKADRPGADRLARELELAVHMRAGDAGEIDEGGDAGHHGIGAVRVGRASRRSDPASTKEGGGWSVPVIQTIAPSGKGLDELLAVIERHRSYLEGSGELERRRTRRLLERTRAVVERELKRLAWQRGDGDAILEAALPALRSGAESPYSVGARIVHSVAGG